MNSALRCAVPSYMHTDELIYDTFIPRWFGRLGNNVQQISNGIYYCMREGMHFTSPNHPMIEPIDLSFGGKEYKLDHTKSHNWFYFYDGPDADFDADIQDLNIKRKTICETYILPKLKVNKDLTPLPDDLLVIHLRCGDLYTHWPGSHPQNPLSYYLELISKFNNNVWIFIEDENHPFLDVFRRMNLRIIQESTQVTYHYLLKAKNLANSGAGSYAISAALCSKNLKRYFCTDLYIENSLNPTMLKDHLEVHMMSLGDKYIKIGGWNYSPETFDKLFNYKDYTLFRRL